MDRNDVDLDAVADDLTSVTPDVDVSPRTTKNSTVDLANDDGGINGNGNTSANANNRSNFGARVGEQTNLQINPPRSRSRSPTCVSQIQVNSKKHVGPKKESLHNKRKVTFKQD